MVLSLSRGSLACISVVEEVQLHHGAHDLLQQGRHAEEGVHAALAAVGQVEPDAQHGAQRLQPNRRQEVCGGQRAPVSGWGGVATGNAGGAPRTDSGTQRSSRRFGEVVGQKRPLDSRLVPLRGKAAQQLVSRTRRVVRAQLNNSRRRGEAPRSRPVGGVGPEAGGSAAEHGRHGEEPAAVGDAWLGGAGGPCPGPCAPHHRTRVARPPRFHLAQRGGWALCVLVGAAGDRR